MNATKRQPKPINKTEKRKLLDLSYTIYEILTMDRVEARRLIKRKEHKDE